LLVLVASSLARRCAFSAWSCDVSLEEWHDGDGLLEDLVLQQLGVEAEFLLPELLDGADEVCGGGSGDLVARTGCTCADSRRK
jgi:hypothetical protein